MTCDGLDGPSVRVGTVAADGGCMFCTRRNQYRVFIIEGKARTRTSQVRACPHCMGEIRRQAGVRL